MLLRPLRRPCPLADLQAVRHRFGFTLVELLVVVTILGVLAMIAGPSLASLIASQRAANAASDLYTALVTARSEAIKRNVVVTVQQKTGGWANGWQVVTVDPNNPSQTVSLLDHSALGNTTVTPGPSTLTAVTFLISGRVQGAGAPSFTITTSSGSTTSSQNLCIDLSGRPYVNSTSCS